MGILIYDLMRSFPREMVSTIRWAVEVDPEAFLKDLHRLAEDLFFMRDNAPSANSSEAGERWDRAEERGQ
jgi:hypothetical protein